MNAETCFRENLKIQCMSHSVFARNVIAVIKKTQKVFNDLKYHVLNQDPLCDHRYILIKVIIQTYFDIRLRYQSKLITTSKTTLRSHLKKYNLFRGQ